LWTTELPASGHSTPVTYMGKDGKQYVVIAASGGTAIGGGRPISDSLVAFRLAN
jgi:glucose dehydrogenase